MALGFAESPMVQPSHLETKIPTARHLIANIPLVMRCATSPKVVLRSQPCRAAAILLIFSDAVLSSDTRISLPVLKIPPGDYKVSITGYADLLERLKAKGSPPSWTRDDWLALARALDLYPLDSPDEDSSLSDAAYAVGRVRRSVSETIMSTAFHHWYRRESI